MKNVWRNTVACLLVAAIFVMPVSAMKNDISSSLGFDNSIDLSHTDFTNTDSNNNLHWMIAGNAPRALRFYWLYIPSSYDESKAVPFVLMLHGNYLFDFLHPFTAFTYNIYDIYTEFSKKAEEEGFILAYPLAKLLLYSPLQTPIFGDKWMYEYNYGWIPSIGQYYNDDIGFIDNLIEKTKGEYNINSSRIYVTGFSAGAFMSYSIAAYLSDKIAAIAPVAGTIGGRAYETKPISVIPDPENPVSVIAFHGTEDQSVPYDGAWYFVSVNSSISFWIEHNGCNPTPEIYISPSGKIIRKTYTNGEKRTETILYTTVGGNHWWPGTNYSSSDPDDIFVDTIQEISANNLIWEFFEAHPKQ